MRERVLAHPLGSQAQLNGLGFLGLLGLPTPTLPVLGGWLEARVSALRPGGALMVATLGPGTLLSWRRRLGIPADAEPRGLDLHDLGDLLSRAGLAAPVTESERLALSYRRFETVMEDLHGLWPCISGPGLRGRSVLARLRDQFEQMRAADGRVCLEFELVFAHGWRGEPRVRAPAATQPVTFQAAGRFG